ncbi:uncharacterized protein [Palaemon carinicauda]|uniref:uncharacterized protein n=1 Tax=Palaemon carinicauda TaxID=392227 RepID=UPI0035B6693F
MCWPRHAFSLSKMIPKGTRWTGNGSQRSLFLLILGVGVGFYVSLMMIFFLQDFVFQYGEFREVREGKPRPSTSCTDLGGRCEESKRGRCSHSLGKFDCATTQICCYRWKRSVKVKRENREPKKKSLKNVFGQKEAKYSVHNKGKSKLKLAKKHKSEKERESLLEVKRSKKHGNSDKSSVKVNAYKARSNTETRKRRKKNGGRKNGDTKKKITMKILGKKGQKKSHPKNNVNTRKNNVNKKAGKTKKYSHPRETEGKRRKVMTQGFEANTRKESKKKESKKRKSKKKKIKQKKSKNLCTKTSPECKKLGGKCRSSKSRCFTKASGGKCLSKDCVCCIEVCAISAKKKCRIQGGSCKKKCLEGERLLKNGCKDSDCKCCVQDSCKIKKSCLKKNGICVNKKEDCSSGNLIKKGCGGKNCFCCIKSRCKSSTKKKCIRHGGVCKHNCLPNERLIQNACKNKKCKCCSPKGCRAKKSCRELNGFCVEQKEDCPQGNITRRGCRGKDCFCCFPLDLNEHCKNDLGPAMPMLTDQLNKSSELLDFLEIRLMSLFEISGNISELIGRNLVKELLHMEKLVNKTMELTQVLQRFYKIYKTKSNCPLQHISNLLAELKSNYQRLSVLGSQLSEQNTAQITFPINTIMGIIKNISVYLQPIINIYVEILVEVIVYVTPTKVSASLLPSLSTTTSSMSSSKDTNTEVTIPPSINTFTPNVFSITRNVSSTETNKEHITSEEKLPTVTTMNTVTRHFSSVTPVTNTNRSNINGIASVSTQDLSTTRSFMDISENPMSTQVSQSLTPSDAITNSLTPNTAKANPTYTTSRIFNSSIQKIPTNAISTSGNFGVANTSTVITHNSVNTSTLNTGITTSQMVITDSTLTNKDTTTMPKENKTSKFNTNSTTVSTVKYVPSSTETAVEPVFNITHTTKLDSPSTGEPTSVTTNITRDTSHVLPLNVTTINVTEKSQPVSPLYISKTEIAFLSNTTASSISWRSSTMPSTKQLTDSLIVHTMDTNIENTFSSGTVDYGTSVTTPLKNVATTVATVKRTTPSIIISEAYTESKHSSSLTPLHNYDSTLSTKNPDELNSKASTNRNYTKTTEILLNNTDLLQLNISLTSNTKTSLAPLDKTTNSVYSTYKTSANTFLSTTQDPLIVDTSVNNSFALTNQSTSIENSTFKSSDTSISQSPFTKSSDLSDKTEDSSSISYETSTNTFSHAVEYSSTEHTVSNGTGLLATESLVSSNVIINKTFSPTMFSSARKLSSTTVTNAATGNDTSLSITEALFNNSITTESSISTSVTETETLFKTQTTFENTSSSQSITPVNTNTSTNSMPYVTLTTNEKENDTIFESTVVTFSSFTTNRNLENRTDLVTKEFSFSMNKSRNSTPTLTQESKSASDNFSTNRIDLYTSTSSFSDVTTLKSQSSIATDTPSVTDNATRGFSVSTGIPFTNMSIKGNFSLPATKTSFNVTTITSSPQRSTDFDTSSSNMATSSTNNNSNNSTLVSKTWSMIYSSSEMNTTLSPTTISTTFDNPSFSIDSTTSTYNSSVDTTSNKHGTETQLTNKSLTSTTTGLSIRNTTDQIISSKLTPVQTMSSSTVAALASSVNNNGTNSLVANVSEITGLSSNSSNLSFDTLTSVSSSSDNINNNSASLSTLSPPYNNTSTTAIETNTASHQETASTSVDSQNYKPSSTKAPSNTQILIIYIIKTIVMYINETTTNPTITTSNGQG